MSNENPIDYFLQKIEDDRLWDKEITLKRNDFLKTNRLKDNNTYLIVTGTIKAFFLEGEEEKIVRFGYSGELIMDMESFLSNQATETQLQALKKTVLKRIPKSAFDSILNESTENILKWNKILGMAIIQFMERERDILTTDPMERYKRVMARSPRLFQEIPDRYIASYLRMAPETLSRIKKEVI